MAPTGSIIKFLPLGFICESNVGFNVPRGKIQHKLHSIWSLKVTKWKIFATQGVQQGNDVPRKQFLSYGYAL